MTARKLNPQRKKTIRPVPKTKRRVKAEESTAQDPKAAWKKFLNDPAADAPLRRLIKKAVNRLEREGINPDDSVEQLRRTVPAYTRDFLFKIWIAPEPLNAKQRAASERRAAEVKRIFRLWGVPESLVVTRYHGKRLKKELDLVDWARKLTGKPCYQEVAALLRIAYRHTGDKRFRHAPASLKKAYQRRPPQEVRKVTLAEFRKHLP